MNAENIENYLFQLGQELARSGVKKPMHILLIGGAYMLLLAHAPRSTDDIDFFWLEEEEEPLHAQAAAFPTRIQCPRKIRYLSSN